MKTGPQKGPALFSRALPRRPAQQSPALLSQGGRQVEAARLFSYLTIHQARTTVKII